MYVFKREMIYTTVQQLEKTSAPDADFSNPPDDGEDARPVIWSLHHNPHDWELIDGKVMKHKKSSIEIWVSSETHYGVWHPYDRKFSPSQQKLFHAAFIEWQKARAPLVSPLIACLVGDSHDWTVPYIQAIRNGAATIVVEAEHAKKMLRMS